MHPKIKTRSYDIDTGFLSSPAYILERCPSGLRSKPGKFVYGKLYRGFESRPLRSSNLDTVFHLLPFSARNFYS